MPEDKWEIPYFYPTKLHAGLTTTGSGFFWQQNNDIFTDSDNGMVRLGKEAADVQVINSTTGEWEFPYLADGDSLDLSGPTGHHSGGETHGCEGFTYMCAVDVTKNPPDFRFRKETYHVQYNDHPDGRFTHPLAPTQIIGSGNWYGFGWVRYNKKDGISAGKDSVICECWWNPNPAADIKNWVMLKRVEDKGSGITNWGVAATCDGNAYQVGTWSNIQFRFKSSSSDWSLHPLEPEFEDGENIHSIGEADMSFSASASRGYGYQARMPRDIEMKCLFKFQNDHTCRFKNVSLREIDPTASFEDDPSTPPPNEEPGGTSTIVGVFKFQQDVNQLRTSACAGAGGGGGSGGTNIFYTVPATSDTELSLTPTFLNREETGEYAVNASSPFIGKIIKQADIWLKKVGSPAASPVIKFNIYNASDVLVYTAPVTIAPNTLTTSFAKYPFNLSGNTTVMGTNFSIGVEYVTTSSTNYVVAGYSTDTIPNTNCYNFESGISVVKSTRDLACDLWE